MEIAPYFYALTENYGSPEEDYLAIYRSGSLTLEGKQIFEALLDKGGDPGHGRLRPDLRTLDDVTTLDALIVGLAQCFALIPGSSRSGTTLTAGLFLGLKRDAAARFSFLLSIPAVLACGLHEMFSLAGDPFQFGVANLWLAVMSAAVSGYLAIAWLLRFLTSRTTMVFVWYRLLLGALLASLLMTGAVTP